jgi:hypothetical protein
LFLVLAFCSLAGIYLMLHAEFVAMVQVIVYAGAIMVLFLFVVMYLNIKTRPWSTACTWQLRRAVGWVLGALLLGETVWFFGSRWAAGPVGAGQSARAGPAIPKRSAASCTRAICSVRDHLDRAVGGDGRRGGDRQGRGPHAPLPGEPRTTTDPQEPA